MHHEEVYNLSFCALLKWKALLLNPAPALELGVTDTASVQEPTLLYQFILLSSYPPTPISASQFLPV